MKSLSIFGILCVGALVASASVHATTYMNYVDGDRYMKMPDAERSAYVEGLSDMLIRMTAAVDDATEKAFLNRVQRCTADMSGRQLRDFIDSYMATDAAFRSYAMASNYRAAMNTRCPP